MSDFYKQFEAHCKAEVLRLKSLYRKKISIAVKDKKINAHNLFEREVLREHQDKARIELGNLQRLTIEVQDYFDLRNESGKTWGEIFNDFFAKQVKPSDRKSILVTLANYEAHTRFYEIWQNELGKLSVPQQHYAHNNETESRLSGKVKWLPQNETEFVQLIYALHEAGYLANEEKEITKLVQQVAQAFNFKLGKNWQSNFSKSINARKPFYEPEIFKKIAEAHRNYRDKQINRKKTI